MKKKTIYFHTGNVKTGTSSVQDFCYMNRYRLLSEHDLYYPLTGTKPSRGAVGPISCNHLRLLYRLSVDQDSENFSTSVVRDIAGEPSPTNIWHQLSEEIGAQSCGKVLVSFETALGYPSFYFYSKPYENGRIFQDLRRWFPENEYDIKFIYYVRRMDDLFISICNQKAQERALGEFVRNSGYADSSYHGLWQQFSTQSRGEVHFWRNQASNIESLLTLVGQENVIIRLFDKSKMKKGNVLDDIFDVMAVSLPGDITPVWSNAKRPEGAVAVLHGTLNRNDYSSPVKTFFWSRAVYASQANSGHVLGADLKEEIDHAIEDVDKLVPGYKDLFNERPCSYAMPEYCISPEDAYGIDILQSLYQQQDNVNYCNLHNRIAEANDLGPDVPILMPTRWGDGKFPLYRHPSGRLGIVPFSGRPRHQRRVFGLAVQKTELYFLDSILACLGFLDCGICAMDDFFYDFRGLSMEKKIRMHHKNISYLPYNIQVHLVPEGHYLLGHTSAASTGKALKNIKPLLMLRDLRSVVTSYAIFNAINAGSILKETHVTSSQIENALLSHFGRNSLNVVVRSCAQAMETSLVVRYEDLMSGDRIRMADSLRALSDATECSEETIFSAVNRAKDSQLMQFSGTAPIFEQQWDDKLDSVFRGMDLHFLNETLGYK